jgi:hypothetical protein
MAMNEQDCWVYLEEIDCLKKYAKDKLVLEIGAYKGGSTSVMGPLAKWIISIDTFMGSNLPDENKGKNTLPEFLHNTSNIYNKIFIKGNSHDLNVVNLIGSNIDFLFIDGDHSYFGVMEDLTNYVPKVKPGGVVALHDYGMKYTGVIAACLNYFKHPPDEVWRTIAVYKV